MADLTLPGTIPGLLRRGSPVAIRGAPGRDYAGEVRRVDEADGTVLASWNEMFSPWWWPLRDVALDLTDPTGAAHAAWWAFPRWQSRWHEPLCDGVGREQWDEYAAGSHLLGEAMNGAEPLTDDQRLALRDLCLRLHEVTRG